MLLQDCQCSYVGGDSNKACSSRTGWPDRLHSLQGAINFLSMPKYTLGAKRGRVETYFNNWFQAYFQIKIDLDDLLGLGCTPYQPTKVTRTR